MVEVLNSTPEPDGSRKTYFLRVPPSTTQRPRGGRLDLRPLVRCVPADCRNVGAYRSPVAAVADRASWTVTTATTSAPSSHR